MKKILITAGGTQEYIDDVRVLTNISTGKLGAMIANELLLTDAKIYYVCGKNAVLPDNQLMDQMIHRTQPNTSAIPFVQIVRTAKDALEAMNKIIVEEKVDAVIHSMAVSDFTFKRDKAVKCKSSDPEAFIDFMRQMITVNPKIISMIKQWYPETTLVGFKFEVGLPTEDLISLAKASIEKNGCDLVIANDKKEMELAQSHIARFVFSDKMKTQYGFTDITVKNKESIAKAIQYFLACLWRENGK